MSDPVDTIAVLDARKPEACRLHLLCKRGSEDHYANIPVHEEGTPKKERDWTIKTVGDTLRIHPSLLIRGGSSGGELFHTAYDWTVKFVKFDEAADSGPADSGPYAMLNRINGRNQ